MGPNEKALLGIADATDFDLPALEVLVTELEGLATTLRDNLNKLEGAWEGTGADSAKDYIGKLRKEYLEVSDTIAKVRPVITLANNSVVNAKSAIDGLPSVQVPDWILHSTDPGNYLGFAFPAVGGASLVAKFLQGKREEAAGAALDQLQVELGYRSTDLGKARTSLHSIPVTPPPGEDDFREPEYTGGDTGGANGTGGGSYGLGGVPVGKPIVETWTPTPSVHDPSKDGNLDPKNPTIEPNPVTPTPLPKPIPGGGGGGGGGLIPGIGGVAGAAGLAAAARAGGLGTGSGGLGASGAAGARLGSGLSGSSAGLAGAGAKGGAGTALGSGGAAGGRGTSSVMGGGAGGVGGDKEKAKRSGLGGLIAPKLEDDEEFGPRSASADAGGRDD